jgi:phosphatidylinositol alpha-1,6-mannosyltransferase
VTRTLFVSNDFPPRRGGIETFVRQLAESYPADEVVVHTSRTPGDAEFYSGLRYPVVRDPAGTLLPTPWVRRRVVDTLRRFDCDRVVFGASAPLGLLAPALRRAGADHITALTHGHEVWWAVLPVTRSLLRRIGDSVDLLTYVSEYCRDRIAPALSEQAAARMRRLSPWVDGDRFRPGCGGAEVRRELGLASSAPVVVCVARMVRRKGQDSLIRIWPEVLREFPDAVLLLVGDGPDRRRLERMARRKRLGDAAVFVGGVPWEAVPSHLDAGDVFAMPVRSRFAGLQVEAFGIVYLEAAACGLRVLPGRSGGSGEAALSLTPETEIEPAGRALVDQIRRPQLEAQVPSRTCAVPAIVSHVVSNVSRTMPPKAKTMMMITAAMAATSRPYSTALAPRSSRGLRSSPVVDLLMPSP